MWDLPTHPLMSKKNTLIAEMRKKCFFHSKSNTLLYLSVLHRDCLWFQFFIGGLAGIRKRNCSAPSLFWAFGLPSTWLKANLSWPATSRIVWTRAFVRPTVGYLNVSCSLYGCFLKWWVFPNLHPKMIIFSRKTHVGETHHFRKPPYYPILINSWFIYSLKLYCVY